MQSKKKVQKDQIKKEGDQSGLKNQENLEIIDQKVDYKDYEDFERIGYFRITGSFYFNIIFAPLALGYVFLIPIFIPQKEALSYYTIVTSLFASIFTLADLGLASALSRFVAEYRIKDPRRTLKYVQFFIWFQAFTGLVQTTVISIIGLYFLKGSYLSYAPWFFCFISIIQYPGSLAVFKEALKGFQEYNKVNIITISNSIIQILTLVSCSQLGAWYGRINPELGETMGSTIGLIVGYYLDDFTLLLISAWLFSKVLEPMGFKLRNVLYWDFGKEIAVESIKFGIGVMAFSFSWQIVQSILSIIYASSFAGYSTLIAAAQIIIPVVSLSEQVNLIYLPNVRPSVSEAYFNDKENYARWVLTNVFRSCGQFIGMITPIAILLTPGIFREFLPEYYSIYRELFLPALMYGTIFQFSHVMNEVLIGTGHNAFNVFITVVENVVIVSMTIVFINLDAGVFVLVWPKFIATLVKQGGGWLFINRRIIDLKVNLWQSFGSTFLAGTIYYGFLAGILALLKVFLLSVLGIQVILALTLVMAIFILPGPFYYFWWGLVGGFDVNTLNDFQKSISLSGPSKFLVKPWYILAKFGSKISPLYNKSPVDSTKVGEEINMLMSQKSDVDKMNS